MFEDKKMKKYAEGRLAAYAESEKSLGALKREQGLQRSAGEKTTRRGLFRRMAFALSAVIVVAITVLLVVVAPGGMSSNDSAEKMAGDVAFTPESGANKAHMDGSKTSEASDENGEIFTLVDLNEEMQYLCLTLPQDVVIAKHAEGEGHAYRFSATSGDVTFTVRVLFGMDEAADLDFESEGEATVAEQTLLYRMTAGELQGKIVTDREICAIRCVGGGVEECLTVLRSMIGKKS